MTVKITGGSQVRNGFLFGIAVVFVAAFAEWRGWAGTRFQAIDDLAVGGVLLLVWIVWEVWRLRRGNKKADGPL